MFTIFTALIVCATVVYIFKNLLPLGNRFLKLLEQKVENSGAQAPKKADPIPQYLWLSAMSESESWAREDTLKRYHQLYEEHGNDWNKVAAIVVPDSMKVE